MNKCGNLWEVYVAVEKIDEDLGNRSNARGDAVPY